MGTEISRLGYLVSPEVAVLQDLRELLWIETLQENSDDPLWKTMD